MNISALDTKQITKVLKALAYSFSSGFVATLTLMSLDFIKAAQGGTGTIRDLVVALIAAAVVGGINASAVYVKQLFTPVE
jgi:hypothetical protein